MATRNALWYWFKGAGRHQSWFRLGVNDSIRQLNCAVAGDTLDCCVRELTGATGGETCTSRSTIRKEENTRSIVTLVEVDNKIQSKLFQRKGKDLSSYNTSSSGTKGFLVHSKIPRQHSKGVVLQENYQSMSIMEHSKVDVAVHDPVVIATNDGNGSSNVVEEARPPGVASRSFYKRDLPCPPAIAFSSDEGQRVFRDAMDHGMLQGFFTLIEQFRTQDEPAFCGLASVAMVLNSLSIDPRRPWKGPWRIFHEKMLDCCIPLDIVQREGITLDQAACLARCNGARVDLYSYGAVSEEAFRDMIREACSTNSFHIIVSYSRRHFLQTGDGHFSPIGGYSPSHDMVCILDTARFKYPPHWVPVSMLYEAMEHKDPTTSQPRGFMKVSAANVMQSVLFALDVRDSWQEVKSIVDNTVPDIVVQAYAQEKNALDALSELVNCIPLPALDHFIASRTKNAACNGGSCVQADAVKTLVSEMRLLPLYNELIKMKKNLDYLERPQSNNNDAKPLGERNTESNGVIDISNLILEKQCMWLLILRDRILEHMPGSTAIREGLGKLLDVSSYKVVDHEVKYLKDQLTELTRHVEIP
jgi:glutathione gamma-glutamylcysteinyltransferase